MSSITRFTHVKHIGGIIGYILHCDESSDSFTYRISYKQAWAYKHWFWNVLFQWAWMSYKHLLCKVESYAQIYYDRLYPWILVNRINLILRDLLNIYFASYNRNIMQFSPRGLVPDGHRNLCPYFWLPGLKWYLLVVFQLGMWSSWLNLCKDSWTLV